MVHIIALVAPSGAGKSTILSRLHHRIDGSRTAISATTRNKRPGEQHGEDYYYYSTEEFEQLIENGDIFEYERVYGKHYYGTLKDELEKRGEDDVALLDLDIRGAKNLKEAKGDEVLTVFITVPSIPELRRRLEKRGTDDEESIQRRLARARKELKRANECDVVVVNDVVEDAVQRIIKEYEARQ